MEVLTAESSRVRVYCMQAWKYPPHFAQLTLASKTQRKSHCKVEGVLFLSYNLANYLIAIVSTVIVITTQKWLRKGKVNL